MLILLKFIYFEKSKIVFVIFVRGCFEITSFNVNSTGAKIKYYLTNLSRSNNELILTQVCPFLNIYYFTNTGPCKLVLLSTKNTAKILCN